MLLSVLTILIVSLCVTSCSEEFDDKVNELEPRSSSDYEYVHSDGEEYEGYAKRDLAKELSCLIANDKRVLDILFNKFNETKEEGHYEDELFWNIEKDKSVLDGKSLSDLLIKQNPKNKALLDYICRKIPACTILKLGNDTSDNKSDKIYYDDGFDDSDESIFIKYFQMCSEDSTLITEEPLVTTFIVRECETYVSPEDLNSERYKKTKNDTKVIGFSCGNGIVLYACLGGGCGGWPPGPGPTTGGDCDCERDCEEGTENLRRFRARDDYEKWRGTGEFVITSIWAEGVTWQESEDRGEIEITGGALQSRVARFDGVIDDNQFVFPDFEMIIWDEEENGSRMTHIWYEDDGGGETERDVTISFEVYGVGVSWPIPISYNNGDELIGSSIVEYCQDIDADGFEYHPSNDVDFYMSER